MKDEKGTSNNKKINAPTGSRNDIQIARRLIHMSTGLVVALIYSKFLTHQSAIYILGISASVIYLFEQVRIKYPEYSNKLTIINKYFLRAEEHLEESAAMPYIMAVLLTIISFPKPVALTAIFTLAVSDPLSAIIGIKFGKNKITKNKSYQGSLAFFISTLIISISVLNSYSTSGTMYVVIFSIVLSLIVTLFELIPIRLDDNITIPLFTATSMWILTTILKIGI